MGISAQSAAQAVLRRYQALHQVEGCTHPNLPMMAKAKYLARSQAVVMTDTIEGWGKETCEYTVFFGANRCLTGSEARSCISCALGKGLEQTALLNVNTTIYVTAAFVFENVDKDAEIILSKGKFEKAFHQPTESRIILRTIGLSCADGKVFCNGKGKKLQTLYKTAWNECVKAEKKAQEEKVKQEASIKTADSLDKREKALYNTKEQKQVTGGAVCKNG